MITVTIRTDCQHDFKEIENMFLLIFHEQAFLECEPYIESGGLACGRTEIVLSYPARKAPRTDRIEHLFFLLWETRKLRFCSRPILGFVALPERDPVPM
ncbi:hypothetical protein KGQ74_03005 [Patescibacteria group bacterium]|nr:hypothetical protein [Patescibacteria group bacterium]